MSQTPTPSRTYRRSASQTPTPTRTISTSKTECPECKSKERDETGDVVICGNCGCELQDSNIVADVQFGESQAGAPLVHGANVSSTDRNPRSGLHGVPGYKGLTPVDSRQNALQKMRVVITWLAGRLNLPPSMADRAVGIWHLISPYASGKDTRTIAAVCLYAACRSTKDNRVMIIDFTAIIRISVFRLGQVFQDIRKYVHLKGFESSSEWGDFQNVQDIEPLMKRFASQLDYGDLTDTVASDAVKILAGMKRDWMVGGRIPQGLIGACLILASRMNNFRRTTREVVYVVRASAQTLKNRLKEFNKTRSSAMSVQQFRQYGGKVRKTADPPSFTRVKKAKKNKKDKKPHKPSTKVPTFVPENEVLEDRELEEETERLISAMQNAGNGFFDANSELFSVQAAAAKSLADERRGDSLVRIDDEIGEDEFADDPEVADCMLSEQEIAAKEKRWVHENEEWMRKRQRKDLTNRLSEASGKEKVPRKRRRT
ncbi:hypothetical protein K402DRAFT_330948, partial [Aulographum hederae CBS 113979]